MNREQDYLEKADELWLKGDYARASEIYEGQISQNPEIKENYWKLGLMFLLQKQEEEAHMTWLWAMSDAEAEIVDNLTTDLVQLLDKEAQRQENLGDNSTAWLVRRHIREIQPAFLDNLLRLLPLSISEESLTEAKLDAWEMMPLIQESTPGSLDSNLLLQGLQKLLDDTNLLNYAKQFAEACLPHLKPSYEFRDILLLQSLKIAYQVGDIETGIFLAELALRTDTPSKEELLGNLTYLYEKSDCYDLALENAKKFYKTAEYLPDKIYANHQIMKLLMILGLYWDEAFSTFARHDQLLKSLLETRPEQIEKLRSSRVMSSTFLFAYFRDEPKLNRLVQNQVAEWFQSWMQIYADKQGYQFQQQNRQKYLSNCKSKLKIGYISYFLKNHSVGWIARGLFQHHDRDKFEIHGYFVDYREDEEDWLQDWYVDRVEFAHKLGGNCLEIARQIAEDKIDILIELDSLTVQSTFQVMALKPAPVQVTWLGFDASGIPAIDYYLADPYVLPEYAQDYYQEKIWRLPQTYIALDGYETGVPTQRRDLLNIPNDAVVYFSGQTNTKRHPQTARLQLQILKQVPDSYFLIKNWPNEEAGKNFFLQLAKEEGIESDRLIFLPREPSEKSHRANLAIADVVLDTYPYNGATTTLETLWMGIPVVTRVGQQWAARNSYTMMMNAGITEGIAWTDEEYIDWGIRLGLDPELRQNIWWKLRQGRQKAALWNAWQFTREMEKAYEQMWEIYLQNNAG